MEDSKHFALIKEILQIVNSKDYSTQKGITPWSDLINSLNYHDRHLNFNDEEKIVFISYINTQIAHWNPEERAAYTDWWVDTEINENWEYGVGGIGYEAKFVGIKTQPHWLFYICKKAVLDKSGDGHNLFELTQEDLPKLHLLAHLEILHLQTPQPHYVLEYLTKSDTLNHLNVFLIASEAVKLKP